MPKQTFTKKLVIATAILAHATAAQALDTLTLDEAVAMALENNRGLRSSALDAEKLGDRLKSSSTRQFPSISLYALGAQQLRSFDFTLKKGVLGTYSGTGPLPSEDVHLQTSTAPTGIFVGRLAQPLTSLIKIRRSLDTLKTGVEMANEQTRADRQKIVRDVKRVYYGLQHVESSLRTVRQTVALYQELAR